MPSTESKIPHWWGTYSLDVNRAGCWQVGPSTLWIHRSALEFRIVHALGNDPLENTVEIQVPYEGSETPWLDEHHAENTDLNRFGFEKTGPNVELLPMLANRPIVIRPETALFIPQKESTKLFVSTPLWCQIRVGSPPKSLQELPLFRPSDTWFGPDTRHGEMCYNSRTKARVRLSDLPVRQHRAITVVQIVNDADEPLYLERLKVPVEHLSLYGSDKQFLWTEAITLERTKGDDSAGLRMSKGPPGEVLDAKLISGPREEAKSNLIVRPFSMLAQKMKED